MHRRIIATVVFCSGGIPYNVDLFYQEKTYRKWLLQECRNTGVVVSEEATIPELQEALNNYSETDDQDSEWYFNTDLMIHGHTFIAQRPR